ncbi:Holliday junction resolvase RuvX [Guptibacillus hwajinpoensis]|uniref:Holliday junction resolvase n=2 Tax=Guptibacillus hwajinpoensis TaxID=208199 RepID=A0ABU0K039_9BACL|nr:MULTISPECIES: Holliday junction resolvase RuvX [Alkalihalobacillus]KMM37569.1 Holliday junction resolvase [Alkalihalobacillus macyae]MDP4550394.1 Holliday junction resolvase RuvX [Alkalihalobacillus macyae]MDQ0481497.1 putative Holliday junction resolvase [Alkalihalobacillus hemicentroti]
MKTLGLDVGTKTIGVALSDAMGWTAQGLETVKRDPEAQDVIPDRLMEIIKGNDVSKIVVGLPKNMNGSIGPSGEACMAFADLIGEHTDLPIQMWDERLTTVAAERMLISADVSRKKRKKVIDKMAAVMILQGYLDSKQN